jgi:hypothetical protein
MSFSKWLLAICGCLFIVSGTALRVISIHVKYNKSISLNESIRYKKLIRVAAGWLLVWFLIWLIGYFIYEFAGMR